MRNWVNKPVEHNPEWLDIYQEAPKEQQERNERLKAAWNEYDTTVDGMKFINDSPHKYLERVALKYGLTGSEVSAWYEKQPLTKEERDMMNRGKR